jgi:protein required for attachment to host cells
MHKETWIVVANSTLARIFRLEGLKLVEMDTLIHPEGRMHEKDLVADKSGNTGDIFTSQRSSYSPPHSAKDVTNTNFAKKVAAHLEQGRNKGTLNRLFIAAGPGFLGTLRNELTTQTQSLIAAEVDKDITHLNPQEIKSHFPIGV